MKIELIPNTGLYSDDYKDFKVVKKDNGVYNYYVTLVNKGRRCPICGEYVTKSLRLVRKRIVHDKNCVIFYAARRLICNCGKTFYEDNPFVSEEKKCSDHLVKCILEDLKRYNHTFLEIAQKYEISVTKVIDIFDSHVQIKRKALKEVISIDEFYFSRRSRNKYAFMILSLNGQIVDIVESRKKNTLLDYFKYIPLIERQRVRYVTMDMNEIYREVVKRRLPNAIICIDSFHVMKLMNDALDSIRVKVMRRYENDKYSDEYFLLKHKNYILFKDDLDEGYHYSKHFGVDMKEYDYLERLLKIDFELTKTYQFIKRYYYFNHYWNEYSLLEVRSYLDNFINECFISNLSVLVNIGATLNNWIEEIVNSFIPYIKLNGELTRLSNGRIEGKNSYIKKMLYLANGYSNFERFRNRAMYCENRYESYSQEKLKNKIKRHFPKKKK